MLKIEGEKVVLVSYLEEHVHVYHEWMKSPYLLEMTASEPLSLEEEYRMQQTWMEDPNKHTFIILDRSISLPLSQPDTTDTQYESRKKYRPGGAMAGDVNVFYHDDDDKTVGEMEVMIAEQDSRRKGLATEAVELMKKYVMQKFGTKHLIAKIKQHNHGSIKLFSERLGFQQTESNDFFNELYFEYPHPTATSSSKLYYEEKEKKEAERERTAEMERKKRLDDVVLPYLQSIITTTTTTTSSSSSSIASIASTSIIAPLTCKQSHSIKLSCLSDCFHKANTAVALLANQITALVTEPSLHNIEGKDDDGQGTRSEHEAEAKAGANANANAEATADRKIKTEKKKKVLERKIKTLTRIRNSKYAKLSKKLEGDQRLAQRCDCTHIHEYAIDSFITSKDPSVCNCVCSPDNNVEI